MKLICTILAFLVLILSAQPVCANITQVDTCCSDEGCSDISESSETGDDDEDCNNCNPFQVCGCCAFGVITPFHSAFIHEVQYKVPNLQWGILSISSIDEPVSGFWQPPRFV